MNIKNIKLSKRLLSLLVAGGISLTPVPGLSLTDNSYNPGTFVKKVMQDETKEYGEYIVKEGDNLSRISEKVCSRLNIESTTKYWPSLAYLNHYPRVIEPGDIIIFPKDATILEELNDKLQESGWTSKYKQTYKVYGVKQTKKKISYEYITKVLESSYGEDVCVDEDFVRLFLKVTGLDSKYFVTNTTTVTDSNYELTEWIPSIEEITEYQEKKTKTKKEIIDWKNI